MYRISKSKLGIAMLNAGVRSAKELAALAGIGINTLSRLNNGGSAKLATVQALAGALNCQPADLLEEA